MIEKVNDKSSIPNVFVVNGKQVFDKRAVAAEFNHNFTNIGRTSCIQTSQGIDF